MEVMNLVCEMCGTAFSYIKRSNGVKPKYCSDECRQKAVKISRKKYIERSKDKKAAKRRVKQQMLEQSIITNSVERASQCSSIDQESTQNFAYEREILPQADTLTMKVLDFAQRLGQLKYEGHELLNELNNLKSEQDKQDQHFLHLVESMDKVTLEQMCEIWKNEADNRTNRRDAKTLYSIINQLIYNIPQNPHQYAKGILSKKEKLNEQYATESKAE